MSESADPGAAGEADPAPSPEAAREPDEVAAASTPAAVEQTDPAPVLQGVDEDSFGEGLNGDRGAILPAVMWGLAAAAIAATSSFVGRRWRKLPSYAMALAPFAVVLFVCFVHIDQAIPSY